MTEQRCRTRFPVDYNFIFQSGNEFYGIKNMSERGMTFENNGKSFQKFQYINGKLINKSNNRTLGNIEGLVIWSDERHSGAQLSVSPNSIELLKLYHALIKQRD